MGRYDANQLKTMLAGATPLQSLSGASGVLDRGMAELGAPDVATQPAMVAPAAQAASNAASWNTVLKGPEA